MPVVITRILILEKKNQSTLYLKTHINILINKHIYSITFVSVLYASTFKLRDATIGSCSTQIVINESTVAKKNLLAKWLVLAYTGKQYKKSC